MSRLILNLQSQIGRDIREQNTRLNTRIYEQNYKLYNCSHVSRYPQLSLLTPTQNHQISFRQLLVSYSCLWRSILPPDTEYYNV